MKRLIFLAAVLTAAIFGEVQAQPGFLGRRNIVRYDLNAMPSLVLRGPGLIVHHSHQLGFERVMSRRTVVGGGVCVLPLYPSSGQLAYSPFSYGLVKRLSTGLGVQVKWHPFLRKGWLAPIGPYFKLSFQFNRLQSTWYELPDLTVKHAWSSHFYTAYAMEFGYSEVLLGRVLLDFGGRFCLANMWHGAAGGSSSTSARVYRDSYALLQSELFKLHLGIGFLF